LTGRTCTEDENQTKGRKERGEGFLIMRHGRVKTLEMRGGEKRRIISSYVKKN